MLAAAPPVGGAIQVPSARKKLTVPPPDAGTAPLKAAVKVLTSVVSCVAVSPIGVPPAMLPSTVLAASVGNCASVICPAMLDAGSPVQLVNVPDVGVPRTGVVNVGDVVIATMPVPLMEYSPRMPALSNNTRPEVPDPIAVEPTVSAPPPAAGAAQAPSARKKLVVLAAIEAGTNPCKVGVNVLSAAVAAAADGEAEI